jgi:hypothetical protein
LKKRTSINSNFRFHKEKEMADFRRCLYALALVALLAGLTVPASAQAFQCQSSTSNVPLVRAEGYTELLGDIVLDCTGGIPTPPGQTVPTVSITVALDQGVDITSQVTAVINGVEFLESLVIIDEPNSPSNPSRQILNCGRTAAPDNTAAGAGVCAIFGGGALGAANTYDGSNNHPNVFQGRSFRLIGGAPNQMVFSGVPIDPPGTICANQSSQPVCHRIIRITNIRGDATAVAVVSSTNTRPINASLNTNPFSGLPVDSASKPIATVELGLSGGLNAPKLDFIQCSPLQNQPQPLVFTFQESFNNVFKPQSLTQTLNNGVAKPSYTYTGGVGGVNSPNTTAGVANNQNVPGAVYDTESGFVNAFAASAGDNALNPLTGQAGAGIAFANDAGSAANTGIALAGIATQGTRLWLGFSSIQAGSSVSVPNVISLNNVIGGAQTGVAVLINNASPSGFGGTPAGAGSTTVAGAGSAGFAVYEVFFANPNALEKAAILMTVSGTPNLPLNLPTPGAPPSQITGSFAPFYTQVQGVREAAFASPAEVISGAPQVTPSRLPIPRFLQLLPAVTLFQINRCSCNLLFPYVTNAQSPTGNFDTAIAIANTSFDPGANNGFFGSQQSGPVQLWFYSKNATPPAEPNFGGGQLNTQCTNATSPGSCTGTLSSVPAGGMLTYTLFFGGAINGGPAGLVLQPAPAFTGYIIAQARFQYCHGFAYISKERAGFNDPTNTSMGYLAIVLDRPAGTITLSNGLTGTITLGLPRTASSPGENDGH